MYKSLYWILLGSLIALPLIASATDNDRKIIHVYVALCDNKNQGIVPVPSHLGNGQDPRTNLYWGALYGVKTHFLNAKDWELINTITKPNEYILERCIFTNNEEKAILVADAYDGEKIKKTIIDFLNASAGADVDTIIAEKDTMFAGGASDLIAYIGHDGLMEFRVSDVPSPVDTLCRQVVILACMSKQFFAEYIEITNACPLIWTTGLMAPEAYTLHAIIKSWLAGKTDAEIRASAAAEYDKYQHCGGKAARNLLVTGK